MKVSVKLFATLRDGRGKQIEVDLNQGFDCSAVLERLNIKKSDVSIIIVNGIRSEFDTKLNEGDTLSLFPPVGGG